MTRLQIAYLVLAVLAAILGCGPWNPKISAAARVIFFLLMVLFFNSILSKYLKL